MLKLVFTVDGQNAKCINNRRIVSDSKNYIYGQVVLYDKIYYDQNECPKITAIFWKDDTTEYVEVDNVSDVFAIPQEYVSVPGSFKINFRISYNDEAVITTDRVNIDVISAGYSEISESDPYQKLLDQVKKLEESVDSTDYEERISKLENSVSDLEERVRKLENGDD